MADAPQLPSSPMPPATPTVPATARTTLVALCRAGFEPEAAADLRQIAAATGTTLAADGPSGRGFVVARPAYFAPAKWARALDASAPVFVRSLFIGSGPHPLLDLGGDGARPDRVAPLVALCAALHAESPLADGADGPPFGALRLEYADTNDGKQMTALCRALAGPLAQALRDRGLLVAGNGDESNETAGADASGSATPCAHVLLVDGATAFVGLSLPPWTSAWPMGIPRIAMPGAAPSRSTLKLAEAFAAFLGPREPQLLRAGMRAVDLGAAPGGWTWQLAHRGLRVTAVDNGPLKGAVAVDPLVAHVTADGLKYRPQRPVDWMVCDIVDQPARIATLVGEWLAQGHARSMIFNLKLPMKKRHAEVLRCAAIIADAARAAGVPYSLALRQLYHDREEVTGYCTATRRR